MTRRFIQETNFDDESEAFKVDALDNIEKHYPDSKRAQAWKEKYKNWIKEPEGDPSF